MRSFDTHGVAVFGEPFVLPRKPRDVIDGRSNPPTRFEVLDGVILSAIGVFTNDGLGDTVVFQAADKRAWVMGHRQDCCENVELTEIHGSFDDLLGAPILAANVVTNEFDNPDNQGGSNLWTFYSLRTIKGSVTLRWRGTSNGYYSVAVDFKKV